MERSALTLCLASLEEDGDYDQCDTQNEAEQDYGDCYVAVLQLLHLINPRRQQVIDLPPSLFSDELLQARKRPSMRVLPVNGQ